MRYPPARRVEVVDDLHGHRVADPYRWLEDPADPATVEWGAAQDALWAGWQAGLSGRDVLAARLRALVPAWRQPPLVIGSRRFWVQRERGEDHPVLWVGDPAGERRLVDPNALAPDGTVTLDGWFPSLEGERLAYLRSSGGDEESELWVLDVATGEPVEGPIDRTRYGDVWWEPGGEAFYYVRRLPPEVVPPGEAAFHRRLWHHQVATPAERDRMVWGEGLDPTTYIGVTGSRDGRWLAVTAAAGTAPRNEVWVGDLAAGGDEPRWAPVLRGTDSQAWPIFSRDGTLWLLTDHHAPRRRLCAVDPAAPGDPEGWREVLPEDPIGVLDDVAFAGEWIAAVRTVHAAAEVTLHPRPQPGVAAGDSGGAARPVPLPGVGSLGLTGRPDEAAELWLSYTDFATPPTVWHLDPATGAATAVPPPAGAAPTVPVHSEQIVVTSADGTEVRVTVIAPAATGAPRPRPTLLYGYGGFAVALSPAYSASTLAWVAAGGVYAVAHLRGGSEEGEAWHRAGMREHKQRVFEDFEAAADGLVAGGWTAPEQLAIMGGSNGGLLVGAAITRSPERYRAVVCSAPLLDMVRYERFGLGATWNDEYGRADDPTELGWLLGYSPYHHVVEGARYPAVLFTTFEGDTRVDPLHARKLCAALQWATAGDPASHPILLRRERDVGHGARAVQRSVELEADELTFLASFVGLDLVAGLEEGMESPAGGP